MREREPDSSQPIYQIDGIPAARFQSSTAAGRPAVVAAPLFPEGWGLAIVLVWDKEAGVLTAVEGEGFTLDELVRIAEGVLR